MTRSIPTDAGRIAYSTIGSGLPILEIHGIISDASFFEGLNALLADQYQLITYDRRGYGESVMEDTVDYLISSQAEDAARLLETAAREPAWIIGNSAGGLIALTLALRYPQLVRGIILLETPVSLDPEITAAIDEWFRQLMVCRDQGKIKKALPLFSRQIGGTAPSAGFDMEKIQRTYRNLEIFLQGELADLHKEVHTEEELRRIICPCHVLVTEHGKCSIFGQSVADAAKKLNWPVHEVPGYHNILQDDPASLLPLLRSIICDEDRVSLP